MSRMHLARVSSLALIVASCGGETETRNPSSDGTAQVGSPLALGCTSSTTATGFSGGSFALQSGTFSFAFDATPASGASDALVGLSSGASSSYAGLAAIVRFNPAGAIDVRNGGGYAADVAFPYIAGAPYHFQFDVNVVSHTYSVHVRGPSPGVLTLLAANYAFRTEQAGVSTLDHYAVKVDAGAGLDVCWVAVTAVCNTAVPGGGFVNKAVVAEGRFLTAAFTAAPGANDIDGVIGLSAHAAGAFKDLAVAVRFSDTGVIEALNGDHYAADQPYTYGKNGFLRFQVLIDVAFHSYTLLVNERVIARNYAFRNQQASVASLANLALVTDSPAGPVTVCDFVETPLPREAIYLHDALTLASHGVVVPTGGAVDPSGNTFTAVRSPAGDQVLASKLDSRGVPIWSRSFPVTGYSEIDFVGGGGDGRVAIVGRLSGIIDFGGAGRLAYFAGENGLVIFVAKLDSSGAFVDGGVGTVSSIRSVVVDTHSTAYVSGTRTNPDRFMLNSFVGGSLHEWGPGLIAPLFLGAGNGVSVDAAGSVYWAFNPRPVSDASLELGYVLKLTTLTP